MRQHQPPLTRGNDQGLRKEPRKAKYNSKHVLRPTFAMKALNTGFSTVMAWGAAATCLGFGPQVGATSLFHDRRQKPPTDKRGS